MPRLDRRPDGRSRTQSDAGLRRECANTGDSFDVVASRSIIQCHPSVTPCGCSFSSAQSAQSSKCVGLRLGQRPGMSLAGIGAIFAGWLMDRHTMQPSSSPSTYFLTALAVYPHRPDHRGDADPCCLRRWRHHEYRANLFARDSRSVLPDARAGLRRLVDARHGALWPNRRVLVAEFRSGANVALPDIFLGASPRPRCLPPPASGC